jgi:SAM-dependent methyltransferase
MQTFHQCPNCGASELMLFYEVENVPVHSVLLMNTFDQAVTYPRGDIRLAFCQCCGFITNAAFDPTVHEYSAQYEGTQSYSPTFSAFNRRMAERLIERYDLRGKKLIEIGCGQGEFLILLCELGANQGIGFDPAYDNRLPAGFQSNRVEFIADFYSEEYTRYHADFVCCKMTLEHISNTAEFVSRVRRSIGDRLDTTVFFQVPNATYVLQDVAFWDIYYEHCSYFTADSLRYLFAYCGFEVLDTHTEYDDQYLTIEVRPALTSIGSGHAEAGKEIGQARQDVERFTQRCQRDLQHWRERLAAYKEAGKRVVLWGGGSKAVAFLTTLKIGDAVQYAVDINPNKHGTYLAGTGHQVVGPTTLIDYQPEVVIVMNPIYCTEIGQELRKMGLNAEMIPITHWDA